MHSFSKGSRAAVALVTSVRSLLKDSDQANARQLQGLMNAIITESEPNELAATVYSLVILAANPLDDEQLADFALKISAGILEE